MAFNPDRLSLFAQPIGEGGIRFFNYETDENEDVILGTSYFEDAEERGLRPYDLIFVSPLSGTREPYILTVESIDVDGDATVVDGSRVSTSIPRYRDRAAVMRIANYDNSYPGADGYTLVVSGRYRRAV